MNENQPCVVCFFVSFRFVTTVFCSINRAVQIVQPLLLRILVINRYAIIVNLRRTDKSISMPCSTASNIQTRCLSSFSACIHVCVWVLSVIIFFSNSDDRKMHVIIIIDCSRSKRQRSLSRVCQWSLHIVVQMENDEKKREQKIVWNIYAHTHTVVTLHSGFETCGLNPCHSILDWGQSWHTRPKQIRTATIEMVHD